MLFRTAGFQPAHDDLQGSLRALLARPTATRDAASRNAELADLKRRLGEGAVETIEPTHALAGRFTLACARGRLKVTVILSPERQPGIQKLVFDVEGAEGGGRS